MNVNDANESRRTQFSLPEDKFHEALSRAKHPLERALLSWLGDVNSKKTDIIELIRSGKLVNTNFEVYRDEESFVTLLKSLPEISDPAAEIATTILTERLGESLESLADDSNLAHTFVSYLEWGELFAFTRRLFNSEILKTPLEKLRRSLETLERLPFSKRSECFARYESLLEDVQIPVPLFADWLELNGALKPQPRMIFSEQQQVVVEFCKVVMRQELQDTSLIAIGVTLFARMERIVKISAHLILAKLRQTFIWLPEPDPTVRIIYESDDLGYLGQITHALNAAGDPFAEVAAARHQQVVSDSDSHPFCVKDSSDVTPKDPRRRMFRKLPYGSSKEKIRTSIAAYAAQFK